MSLPRRRHGHSPEIPRGFSTLETNSRHELGDSRWLEHIVPALVQSTPYAKDTEEGSPFYGDYTYKGGKGPLPIVNNSTHQTASHQTAAHQVTTHQTTAQTVYHISTNIYVVPSGHKSHFQEMKEQIKHRVMDSLTRIRHFHHRNDPPDYEI